jgi:hypothetical protein
VALKIDRSKMEKILTADADNERLFFKQLSRAIGDRMMTLYARLP